MKALEDLFLQSLEDMYEAEQRIVKALPDLIEAATCSELKQELEAHLAEAETHLERLEEVFESLGKKPKAKKNAAITGILDEAVELIAKNRNSPNLNAAIICAGQKLKHYGIATYGCLASWAQTMDNSVSAEILAELLDEEKSADCQLSELAVEKNEEALEAVRN